MRPTSQPDDTSSPGPDAGAPSRRGDPLPPVRGPRELLVLAAGFGLVAGLGEVILRVFLKLVFDQVMRVPLQVVWMAPVANIVLFVLVGVVLLAAGMVFARMRTLRFTLAVFGAMAVLAWLLLVRLNGWACLLLAAGIGWRVAGRLETAWLRNRRGRRFAIPAFIVILLAFGLNAALFIRERSLERSLTAAPAGATNVLFIIWDTVRAKSLGLYGGDRANTPNLEALAARGLSFNRAISTSPWTLPAHASMFTGRLPHETSVAWYHPLDDEFPTVAERLREHGWRTGAFAANVLYVDWEHGLLRGFTHTEDYRVTPGQIMVSSVLGGRLLQGGGGWTPGLLRTLAGHANEFIGRKEADHVNADFLAWLDRRGEDRPFFAFLNYFDAHLPYDPPAPFDTLFGPRRRSTTFHERLRRRVHGRDKWDLSEEDLAAEVRMYDASIAYLDSRLGMLLDSLEARQLLDNTLVIVTSDHGEAFGEHGDFEHGSSLYFEQTHVPLVMAYPGRLPEAVVIDDPVSTRDLAATIDAIALGEAERLMPGPSLTRFWTADNAPAHALVVSELVPGRTPDQRMTGIMGGGLHYIRNPDDRIELYDWVNDWAETTDLGLTASADSLIALVRNATNAATSCSGLRCCCPLPPDAFPPPHGAETQARREGRQ